MYFYYGKNIQYYKGEELYLANIRKFKSGVEMLEAREVVVCFDFQKKVLEEYFDELAKLIIIEA